MTPRKNVGHQEKASTPRPGSGIKPGNVVAAPPESRIITPRRSLRQLEKASTSRNIGVTTPPGTEIVAPPGSTAAAIPGCSGEAPPGSDVGAPQANIGTASLRMASRTPRAMGRIIRKRNPVVEPRRPRGRPKRRKMPVFGPKRARGRPRLRRVAPAGKPPLRKSVFKRTLDFLKLVLPLVIPALLPLSFLFK